MMVAPLTFSKGFTLVELVAVLIILGIISATAASRFYSSSSFELQASRDQLISSIRSAQQFAMAQRDSVQFSVQSNQLFIHADRNQNGVFDTPVEVVDLDGVNYPFSLHDNVSISNAALIFDRLGRTTEALITLSLSGDSVSVRISSLGFAE